MTADGHQINVHFIYINGYFAYSLSSICMEKYLVFFTDLAYFFQGLSDTDLIIDEHARHHQSVRSDSLL